MTAIKSILNIIPIVQAGVLVGHTAKFAQKKDKTAKDFLKVGTTAIIGTELIKIESGLIGGL